MPDKNAAGYESINKSAIFNSDIAPKAHAVNKMTMELSEKKVVEAGVDHSGKSWGCIDSEVTIDSTDTQDIIDDCSNLSEIIARAEGKFKSQKENLDLSPTALFHGKFSIHR